MDFKTRLIEEKNKLEEKLDKLDAFLISDKVDGIADVQKALLLFNIKLKAMAKKMTVKTTKKGGGKKC